MNRLDLRSLEAVIFDWAGTTIDYGSRAPTQVFLEIFKQRGVEITVAEARGPMGRAKRDHIAAVASLPRVAAEWRQRFGHEPTDADVQAMYDDFLPLQKATLAQGSNVIPGIPQAIAALRDRGLKIGSTTGYTRALMEVVAPIAARGGYAPDVIVCSDDGPAGRPDPWMNQRAAELLGVLSMSSVLVVDDTAVGIEAGLNAGALTVAVTQTGNALGLSAEEVALLPAPELQARLTQIEQDFRSLGAQMIIPSVAQLPLLFR
ncbi:phosphonoacetaldehyde hydrolase [Singulisphaera sp. GP187]|uniref:phosphonoacetaldehyde hydrolase n=1 Tax=Singulisphaera sp. GP187 TaxID=1882752 RepID=UPI00092B41D3|nr:phosphonoacetaldehyde hydrolase [Singulisphaera sp. GP187]SIO61629.1 phosphonoacetaldehyde hydrolase [Singulisphaera sp. GP187]